MDKDPITSVRILDLCTDEFPTFNYFSSSDYFWKLVSHQISFPHSASWRDNVRAIHYSHPSLQPFNTEQVMPFYFRDKGPALAYVAVFHDATKTAPFSAVNEEPVWLVSAPVASDSLGNQAPFWQTSWGRWIQVNARARLKLPCSTVRALTYSCLPLLSQEGVMHGFWLTWKLARQ